MPGRQSIRAIGGGIILARATDPDGGYTHVAYSAETGQELWTQKRPATPSSPDMGTLAEGVYTEFVPETMEWYGYEVSTGNQLWGPVTPHESDWAFYGTYAIAAYGKHYMMGYDGRLICLDLKTGNYEWTYYVGSGGLETPYGHWPLSRGLIADGKIFTVTSEHSPSSPPWRGERIHVVDAFTGEGVWSMEGWWMQPCVADGYLVALNGYDNQIYCFGKGQTATTVIASPKVVADGSTVLIEGTIIDQSPSQPGTPCVSPESQEDWMNYLHAGKPIPMDTTGVSVKLEAFGADGSYVEIGTVMSDTLGFRSEWTPPSEGLYTILATFEGDDSYWSSYAATGLSVGPAPSPYEPIEPEEPTAPLITTEQLIIAVVIVAIVIAAVSFYLLRRRRTIK